MCRYLPTKNYIRTLVFFTKPIFLPKMARTNSNKIPKLRKQYRLRGKKRRKKHGCGFLNSVINKLPFELHLPGGYNYCGPGTRLKERLSRGDKGINPLDNACKEHDIAYATYPNDLKMRHEADKLLEDKAWERVNAPGANIAEKAAAWAVTNAIKGKRKMGMGGVTVTSTRRKRRTGKTFYGSGLRFIDYPMHKNLRGKKRKGERGKTTTSVVQSKDIPFSMIIKRAQKAVNRNDSVERAVKNALFALRRIKTPVRSSSIPRVIPLPTTGGALPIIPILAGLSKIGSIAGGIGAIVSAVKELVDLKNRVFHGKGNDDLIQRYHLRSIGGKGLYVIPYRRGLGLYVYPRRKN
jgi:Phospholipase A2-like domain